MKTADEMDRNIKLRSTELGFKAVILALAIWNFYEMYQTLFVNNGSSFNILPALIVMLATSVQGFSEMAIKRKMIAGDEEYKEPNKLLRAVISIAVISAIILSISVYLMLKITI